MNKQLTFRAEGDTPVICLSGRIDSANAGEIDAEIGDFLKDHPGQDPMVDLDETVYVSSAGIRVLLKLRKQFPGLKVINVQSQVWEILEMTGLTEMIDIRKAYRHFDVEGCEVIGRGANGTVYRLDPDTIIKVYNNPDALQDIDRERALARKAFVMGIPTAIPFDVARVGELYGTVFELLNADSLAKLMVREPENVEHYIDVYISLLKLTHSREFKPGEVPECKPQYLERLQQLEGVLPRKTYDRLARLLQEIPDDLHMIHGDFHLKNVMMQNGEAIMIDMDTLCSGSPVFELAQIYNSYKGFYELDREGIREFLGITPELGDHILDRTFRGYFGTDDPDTLLSMTERCRTVGLIRLLARCVRLGETRDMKREIAWYTDALTGLADRMDTLIVPYAG